MTVITGVLTTRAGQGSTTWLLSLAYAMAGHGARVLVADLDASGMGTVATQLGLNPAGRSVANLHLAQREPHPDLVRAQLVEVPARPGLDVLPGSFGYPTANPGRLLPRLVPALRGLEHDHVLLDLGQPLLHPDAESPRRVAEAIGRACDRLYVVLRDSPNLIGPSLSCLVNCGLGPAEVVLVESHNRVELRGLLAEALATSLPGLRLGMCVPASAAVGRRAESSDRPPAWAGPAELAGGVPGAARRPRPGLWWSFRR